MELFIILIGLGILAVITLILIKLLDILDMIKSRQDRISAEIEKLILKY